ncbi:MAG TPA: isoprenylcysteine carboxylmethyltransferase family protein [Candidatus Limnocylindria bacterium]
MRLVSRLRGWLSSSPRQTFVAFPLAVLLFEAITRRRVRIHARWLPLLVAGYTLYRGAGEYRERHDAGTPGFERPPRRLLTAGPYAVSRNPMYLGHLMFMAGLVLATRSRLAVVLALRQYVRFTERVAVDERRLERIFGDEYRDYLARVPRWIGRMGPPDAPRRESRSR